MSNEQPTPADAGPRSSEQLSAAASPRQWWTAVHSGSEAIEAARTLLADPGLLRRSDVTLDVVRVCSELIFRVTGEQVIPADQAAAREARGAFVPLPTELVRGSAWRECSHPARSLLVDMATQFDGANNGRLVATLGRLKHLGWTSNDTLARAVRELERNGLVHCTRRGGKRTASLYAIPFLGGYEVFDA